ncbi:type VII secretion-associated serine protease mycosin [Streptomyces sp. PmtG]
MHAPEMWKSSTGRGITVAVIDSGVDDSIADLRGQVLNGKDYSTKSGDEHTDHDRHGTGMAALIAGTGARGAANGSYGLAPDAKILPIRMKYAEEDYGKVDSGSEYARKLTEAIRYAADSRAQIINISMGKINSSGTRNVSTPALAEAVKYAIGKGKLIFAAVGNSGDKSNLFEYPAATPGVIGIGAIGKSAARAKWSQWGPQVDLVAPGESIVSACPGGTGVCRGSGTSGATALASASAALIWSKHPTWTNNQVLRVLMNTAGKPVGGKERTNTVGYGAVRPRIALTSPGDPGPADKYPLPDLAAAEPKAPASGPSAKAGGSADGGEESGRKDSDPVAASKDEEGSSLRIALGLGGAVLAGAVVSGYAVRTRRRRNAEATVQVPPPLPHHVPHQPFGPPQGDGFNRSSGDRPGSGPSL